MRSVRHGSIIVVTALVAAVLGACGQKGPLYVPDTPAAAQRTRLPQTVFGANAAAARPAASAPNTRNAPPPIPMLPDITDPN